MDNGKMSLWDAVKYTLKFIKGFRVQLILFYIAGFLDVIASVISPILFGEMINQIVYYKNIEVFYKIGIVFFVITVFTCIMYFTMYYMYSYLWNMLNFRVRRTVFKKMQIIDAEEMTNQNYGDVVNLIHTQSQEAIQLIIRNVIHPVNQVLMIGLCIILMFMINYVLAIAMMILVPLATYITYFMGGKIRYFRDQYWIKYASYTGWLFEMLGALKDIRLLGAEKRTEKLYYKQQKDMNEVDVKAGISRLTSENILNTCNLVFKLALYGVLTYLAIYSNVNIGVVIIVLSYFTILSNNLSYIARCYNDAQTRIKIIEKLKNFLENTKEERWTGNKDLKICDGTIEFKNVSFSYKNKEKVLKDICLKVSKGEKMAIVGESGCGKTTLINMLLGYYKPDGGRILIDREDLQEFTLTSIRKNVGLIQQDVLLFDGTIRENIIIGRPDASEEQIKRACVGAGIYDFINSLDNKFETVVGVNGRQLSGGQKQRIAIARIYLKDPKIIVFDEATSALDDETEKMIHDSWKDILGNRTAVVIAHRLSAVMLCDKVAIMKEGEIIELGNPNDLIKQSEEFRFLFALEN